MIKINYSVITSFEHLLSVAIIKLKRPNGTGRISQQVVCLNNSSVFIFSPFLHFVISLYNLRNKFEYSKLSLELLIFLLLSAIIYY